VEKTDAEDDPLYFRISLPVQLGNSRTTRRILCGFAPLRLCV